MLNNLIKTKCGGGRLIGLDLLRCLAIFGVIAGHFFSVNTRFYDEIFMGSSMFLQGWATAFLYTGVPLFLMLTGYLNKNKLLSRGYYKGCVRVMVSYLFFSILTVLFRKYYLHDSLSWIEWGKKILDFTAIPYAWYIEMWIGLYLLTPFLNLLYKAIPTKKQKQIFLLTLMVLISLPYSSNVNGRHIFPDFWNGMYPVLFFYIGSYIAEYKPKVSIKLILPCMLICSLLNPIYNVFISHEHLYSSSFGGQFGIFGVVIVFSIFLLGYQLDFQNSFARWSLMKISLLSLDMYLCCYIWDQLVYPYFIDHYFVDQSQFGKWFFVIVPILFAGSFALAWSKDLLAKAFASIFYKLR